MLQNWHDKVALFDGLVCTRQLFSTLAVLLLDCMKIDKLMTAEETDWNDKRE